VGGCDTTYVYCPGISTCFIDIFNKGAWGWSIDLGGVDLSSSGASLTCPIYKGAGQCVRTDDRIVGSFTITKNSVNWSLAGNLASDFHLYAGKCQTNDAGNHLSDGVCDFGDMEKFARVPGKYSLVAEVSPALEDFTFDSSNQASFRKELWASYNLFPLGGSGRRYMSAHASVCECEGGDCPAAIEINNSEEGVSEGGGCPPAIETVSSEEAVNEESTTSIATAASLGGRRIAAVGMGLAIAGIAM
jgi:hypothetical protein